MRPDWDDVAEYFVGSECDKCPYFRMHRDGLETFVRCGLMATWNGLGREPVPTDCPGVEDYDEEPADQYNREVA